jgi:hypothetical protein
MDVPRAVKAEFAKAYPNVAKVKWEKEDGKYEASFKQNGHKMSVLYSADGAVNETETTIGINELPAAAKKYASSRGKIKEAAIIVAADGSKQYEAEVGKKDLLFNERGDFVSERSNGAQKR